MIEIDFGLVPMLDHADAPWRRENTVLIHVRNSLLMGKLAEGDEPTLASLVIPGLSLACDQLVWLHGVAEDELDGLDRRVKDSEAPAELSRGNGALATYVHATEQRIEAVPDDARRRYIAIAVSRLMVGVASLGEARGVSVAAAKENLTHRLSNTAWRYMLP